MGRCSQGTNPKSVDVSGRNDLQRVIIDQSTLKRRSEVPISSILGVSGAFHDAMTRNDAFDLRENALGRRAYIS